MKVTFSNLFTAATACVLLGVSSLPATSSEPLVRSRLVITTDLSNEPDDEESLVRFLVYANEFDVEGLIASTSTHLKEGTREDLLHHGIDAYAQVVTNLSKHAPGYPTAAYLHSVCRTGQTNYGMAAVAMAKIRPAQNSSLRSWIAPMRARFGSAFGAVQIRSPKRCGM